MTTEHSLADDLCCRKMLRYFLALQIAALLLVILSIVQEKKQLTEQFKNLHAKMMLARSKMLINFILYTPVLNPA